MPRVCNIGVKSGVTYSRREKPAGADKAKLRKGVTRGQAGAEQAAPLHDSGERVRAGQDARRGPESLGYAPDAVVIRAADRLGNLSGPTALQHINPVYPAKPGHPMMTIKAATAKM